jgi:hypothetical protein
MQNPDLPKDLQPSHPGHFEIGDDQGKIALVHAFQPEKTARGGDHGIAPRFQDPAQTFPDHLIVVDYENLCLAHTIPL